MPKEVTDPDVIRQFNEAGGKEVTDPNTAKEFNRGGDPVRDYVAPFAKGVAQSYATSGEGILEGGEKVRDVYGGSPARPHVSGLPKLLSVPSALADIIPQSWRDKASEFAGQESESGSQTAGKAAGYVSQAAGAAAVAPKLVTVPLTVAGTTAFHIAKWQAADYIGQALGLPPWWIYHVLGGTPGFRRGGGKGEPEKEAPAASKAPQPAKPPPPRAAPSTSPAPAAPPKPRTTTLPGTFPWKPEAPTQ